MKKIILVVSSLLVFLSITNAGMPIIKQINGRDNNSTIKTIKNRGQTKLENSNVKIKITTIRLEGQGEGELNSNVDLINKHRKAFPKSNVPKPTKKLADKQEKPKRRAPTIEDIIRYTETHGKTFEKTE